MDLKEIGEQLGVGYILEGTINKKNTEIEVTARLVDAQTGFEIFPYNRREHLDAIFDIREELARAVAGALSIKLEIEGRHMLRGTTTDSVQAFDLFLRASTRAPSERHEQTRAELYELALEIDPDYVEAMSGLGGWYGAVYSWQLPPEEARAAQEHGRSLVERATEIDPSFSIAWRQLSAYQWARGDWIGATELHEKYSMLEPMDIPARFGSANILGKVGRTTDALAIGEIARDLDPLNFNAAANRAEQYTQASRFDEAEKEIAHMVALSSENDQAVRLRQMLIAFGRGDRQQIATALERYGASHRVEDVRYIIGEVLQSFDRPRNEILERMGELLTARPSMRGEAKLILASVAAHIGDPQLALDIFGPEVRGNKVRIGRLWYPHFSDMRRLDGFKELARDVGFVDYWRKYEWADHCRPLGYDDFECE